MSKESEPKGPGFALPAWRKAQSAKRKIAVSRLPGFLRHALCAVRYAIWFGPKDQVFDVEICELRSVCNFPHRNGKLFPLFDFVDAAITNPDDTIRNTQHLEIMGG